MSFARAAAPHFGEVRVIAAIGDDQWSDIILRAAGELGVLAYFGQQPGVPNGLVMIVRDAGTPENPGGVRLMLAQKPSPYDHLDVQLVRGQQDVIATSDALVIDGYALLHDCSAAAVDVATQIAMDAGVPVSFDLVPHTIDQQVPAGRIGPFLDRASIRIAEAPTLARLLGLPPSPEPSPEYAAELVAAPARQARAISPDQFRPVRVRDDGGDRRRRAGAAVGLLPHWVRQAGRRLRVRLPRGRRRAQVVADHPPPTSG